MGKLRNWFPVCGAERSVRVVHGDGQVLYLPPASTVEEVLQKYPHHFLCQPSANTLPTYRTAMLPLDLKLASGSVYWLLPLPRLFPFSSATPRSCPCFARQQQNMGQKSAVTPTHILASPGRTIASRPQDGSLNSPVRYLSSPTRSFKKNKAVARRAGSIGLRSSVIYPVQETYQGAKLEKSYLKLIGLYGGIDRWRPELHCISEDAISTHEFDGENLAWLGDWATPVRQIVLCSDVRSFGPKQECAPFTLQASKTKEQAWTPQSPSTPMTGKQPQNPRRREPSRDYQPKLDWPHCGGGLSPHLLPVPAMAAWAAF